MSEDTNYPFHAMIIKGGPAELKAIAHLVASYRDNGVAPGLGVWLPTFPVDNPTQAMFIELTTALTEANRIAAANEWAAARKVGDIVTFRDEATKEILRRKIEAVEIAETGETMFRVGDWANPVPASNTKLWEGT
jgi:hypothetical protein